MKPSGRRWRFPLAISLSFGVPTLALADRVDLAGTWLQLSGSSSTIELTPVGQAALAEYSPLRDDPDLECKPASLTNVITIPDPPLEIRLSDNMFEIDYEYIDVRRRVPLDPALDFSAAPYTVAEHSHLGRSVGHFEGDALIIQTGDVGKGVVNTLFAAEGYPQSTQMRYEERYQAIGDRLYVKITHTDPVNYVKPFDMSFEFARVDLEVLDFDCAVEAAGYDDRL